MFGYAENTPPHIIADIKLARANRDAARSSYTRVCEIMGYTPVTAENTDAWYASFFADLRHDADLTPAEMAIVSALKADEDAAEAEYAKRVAANAQWEVPYGENDL